MFAPALHRTSEGSMYESRRTKRAGTNNALAVISQLDADIVVVPEFGVVDELPANTRGELKKMGYELFEFPYNDEYRPAIGMAIITRLPVVSHTTYRLGERRSVGGVVVQANGQQLCVIAIHLDDKKEETRIAEVADLAEIVNKQPEPVLVMGDFNAMPGADWFARLVRSKPFALVVQTLPKSHLQYVFQRLAEMGKGTAIQVLLAQTKLHNLDMRNRRTITAKSRGLEWLPSIRLAKIDWIFASKNLHASSYTVLHDVGSDHRPVVATVSAP